jgi:single-strand selective monofunctional uracil DNA glycosylase
MNSVSEALLSASTSLREELDLCHFAPPITHVYNPLHYAGQSQAEYLRRYADGTKKVLFLGMNPGPWGMAQTGVPFGEILAVRDWMGIRCPVTKPEHEHPKRPIIGFDCTQSEVSGRRLWGLFAERYITPRAFFADHLVINYCPLVFMLASGANFTPDKLPAAEARPVEAACDRHLAALIAILQPQWLIGVGGFAEAQARKQLAGFPQLKVGRILHPSPASPAANRDWSGTATRQLVEMGVW